MTSCYVPGCGRGRVHAGSHGPAPPPAAGRYCPPAWRLCTTEQPCTTHQGQQP